MAKCAQISVCNFDDQYIVSLLKGNREIENHFAAYFSRDLDQWLRGRLRNAAAIEDIRQETLRRVLEMLHRSALRNPNRLSSFVHGVCRRVLLEQWRRDAKLSFSDDLREQAEERYDPERALSTAENIHRLRTAMLALPSESRQLLSLLYLHEQDRVDVSRRIGVSPNYLRVLIHRAILRLRSLFYSCANSDPMY